MLGGGAEVVGLDFRGFKTWRGAMEPIGPQPPPPLTASLLREVPFGALIDRAWQSSVRFRRMTARQAAHTADTLEVLKAQTAARSGRTGRPPLSPEHLAEVAKVHRESRLQGENPTASVATRFGISYAAASKRVAKARQLGLLERTTPGRAGAGRVHTDRRKGGQQR